MKRRIFVSILALVLSISALIVSIGIDLPIVFFIGLVFHFDSRCILYEYGNP